MEKELKWYVTLGLSLQVRGTLHSYIRVYNIMVSQIVIYMYDELILSE